MVSKTTMQERNASELERLDRAKHGDFLVVLKGFVSDQELSSLQGKQHMQFKFTSEVAHVTSMK